MSHSINAEESQPVDNLDRRRLLRISIICAIVGMITGGYAYHRWTLRSETVRFGTINKDGSVTQQSLGKTVYQQMKDVQYMVDGGYSSMQGQLNKLKAKHRLNMVFVFISACFIIASIAYAINYHRKQSIGPRIPD